MSLNINFGSIENTLICKIDAISRITNIMKYNYAKKVIIIIIKKK